MLRLDCINDHLQPFGDFIVTVFLCCTTHSAVQQVVLHGKCC